MTDESLVKKWWFDVIEPHMRISETRPYHNLTHVADLFLSTERFGVTDRASVGLAIYFHDVIYEPTSKEKETNEERSARLFSEFAHEAHAVCKEAWTQPDRIEDVHSWILETMRHTSTNYVSPFSHDDFLVFLDCDMSILGSPHPRYERYRREVRQEYAHLPDADFIKGRTAFLKSTLIIPPERLFKTERIRAAILEQAKSNISWELAELSNRKL